MTSPEVRVRGPGIGPEVERKRTVTGEVGSSYSIDPYTEECRSPDRQSRSRLRLLHRLTGTRRIHLSNRGSTSTDVSCWTSGTELCV